MTDFIRPRFLNHYELFNHLFANKGVDFALTSHLFYTQQHDALAALITFILSRPRSNPSLPNGLNELQLRSSLLSPGFRLAEIASIEFLGINFGFRTVSTSCSYLFSHFQQFSPEMIDLIRIIRGRDDWGNGEEFRKAIEQSPFPVFKKKLFSSQLLFEFSAKKMHKILLSYSFQLLFTRLTVFWLWDNWDPYYISKIGIGGKTKQGGTEPQDKQNSNKSVHQAKMDNRRVDSPNYWLGTSDPIQFSLYHQHKNKHNYKNNLQQNMAIHHKIKSDPPNPDSDLNTQSNTQQTTRQNTKPNIHNLNQQNPNFNTQLQNVPLYEILDIDTLSEMNITTYSDYFDHIKDCLTYLAQIFTETGNEPAFRVLFLENYLNQNDNLKRNFNRNLYLLETGVKSDNFESNSKSNNYYLRDSHYNLIDASSIPKIVTGIAYPYAMHEYKHLQYDIHPHFSYFFRRFLTLGKNRSNQFEEEGRYEEQISNNSNKMPDFNPFDSSPNCSPLLTSYFTNLSYTHTIQELRKDLKELEAQQLNNEPATLGRNPSPSNPEKGSSRKIPPQDSQLDLAYNLDFTNLSLNNSKKKPSQTPPKNRDHDPSNSSQSEQKSITAKIQTLAQKITNLHHFQQTHNRLFMTLLSTFGVSLMTPRDIVLLYIVAIIYNNTNITKFLQDTTQLTADNLHSYKNQQRIQYRSDPMLEIGLDIFHLQFKPEFLFHLLHHLSLFFNLTKVLTTLYPPPTQPESHLVPIYPVNSDQGDVLSTLFSAQSRPRKIIFSVQSSLFGLLSSSSYHYTVLEWYITQYLPPNQFNTCFNVNSTDNSTNIWVKIMQSDNAPEQILNSLELLLCSIEKHKTDSMTFLPNNLPPQSTHPAPAISLQQFTGPILTSLIHLLHLYLPLIPDPKFDNTLLSKFIDVSEKGVFFSLLSFFTTNSFLPKDTWTSLSQPPNIPKFIDIIRSLCAQAYPHSLTPLISSFSKPKIAFFQAAVFSLVHHFFSNLSNLFSNQKSLLNVPNFTNTLNELLIVVYRSTHVELFEFVIDKFQFVFSNMNETFKFGFLKSFLMGTAQYSDLRDMIIIPPITSTLSGSDLLVINGQSIQMEEYIKTKFPQKHHAVDQTNLDYLDPDFVPIHSRSYNRFMGTEAPQIHLFFQRNVNHGGANGPINKDDRNSLSHKKSERELPHTVPWLVSVSNPCMHFETLSCNCRYFQNSLKSQFEFEDLILNLHHFEDKVKRVRNKFNTNSSQHKLNDNFASILFQLTPNNINMIKNHLFGTQPEFNFHNFIQSKRLCQSLDSRLNKQDNIDDQDDLEFFSISDSNSETHPPLSKYKSTHIKIPNGGLSHCYGFKRAIKWLKVVFSQNSNTRSSHRSPTLSMFQVLYNAWSNTSNQGYQIDDILAEFVAVLDSNELCVFPNCLPNPILYTIFTHLHPQPQYPPLATIIRATLGDGGLIGECFGEISMQMLVTMEDILFVEFCNILGVARNQRTHEHDKGFFSRKDNNEGVGRSILVDLADLFGQNMKYTMRDQPDVREYLIQRENYINKTRSIKGSNKLEKRNNGQNEGSKTHSCVSFDPPSDVKFNKLLSTPTNQAELNNFSTFDRGNTDLAYIPATKQPQAPPAKSTKRDKLRSITSKFYQHPSLQDFHSINLSMLNKGLYSDEFTPSISLPTPTLMSFSQFILSPLYSIVLPPHALKSPCVDDHPKKEADRTDRNDTNAGFGFFFNPINYYFSSSTSSPESDVTSESMPQKYRSIGRMNTLLCDGLGVTTFTKDIFNSILLIAMNDSIASQDPTYHSDSSSFVFQYSKWYNELKELMTGPHHGGKKDDDDKKVERINERLQNNRNKPKINNLELPEVPIEPNKLLPPLKPRNISRYHSFKTNRLFSLILQHFPTSNHPPSLSSHSDSFQTPPNSSIHPILLRQILTRGALHAVIRFDLLDLFFHSNGSLYDPLQVWYQQPMFYGDIGEMMHLHSSSIEYRQYLRLFCLTNQTLFRQTLLGNNNNNNNNTAHPVDSFGNFQFSNFVLPIQNDVDLTQISFGTGFDGALYRSMNPNNDAMQQILYYITPQLDNAGNFSDDGSVLPAQSQQLPMINIPSLINHYNNVDFFPQLECLFHYRSELIFQHFLIYCHDMMGYRVLVDEKLTSRKNTLFKLLSRSLITPSGEVDVDPQNLLQNSHNTLRSTIVLIPPMIHSSLSSTRSAFSPPLVLPSPIYFSHFLNHLKTHHNTASPHSASRTNQSIIPMPYYGGGLSPIWYEYFRQKRNITIELFFNFFDVQHINSILTNHPFLSAFGLFGGISAMAVGMYQLTQVLFENSRRTGDKFGFVGDSVLAGNSNGPKKLSGKFYSGGYNKTGDGKNDKQADQKDHDNQTEEVLFFRNALHSNQITPSNSAKSAANRNNGDGGNKKLQKQGLFRANSYRPPSSGTPKRSKSSHGEWETGSIRDKENNKTIFGAGRHRDVRDRFLAPSDPNLNNNRSNIDHYLEFDDYEDNFEDGDGSD